MVSRGREGEHLRRDTGTGVWSTRRAEEAALVTGEEYSSRRSAGGPNRGSGWSEPRLGAQRLQEGTSRGASGPFRGPGGARGHL